MSEDGPVSVLGTRSQRRAGSVKALLAGFVCLSVNLALSPSIAHAGDKEESNKRTVLGFYEAGLNKKDFDAAAAYIGPVYIQHNTTARDGREGFHQFVDFLRREHPKAHNNIVKVVAEGDLVVLHVHEILDPGDLGTAIVDIYRLERGKIVEHWDVKQAVPATSANSNGMFASNRPGAGH